MVEPTTPFIKLITIMHIAIWQFAVILVLVPTLCRGGRGGTRLYDILSGTRLPGTRSICIVFVLVYEIWHKVSIPTLAQG